MPLVSGGELGESVIAHLAMPVKEVRDYKESGSNVFFFKEYLPARNSRKAS